VDTYINKENGDIHDYGVQVYFPYGDALDFFGKVNVTINERPPSARSPNRYVDFSTGGAVAYAEPDGQKGMEAVRKFHDLLVEKGYDKMTEPGYWNLPAGDKIPEDLLLPVGQFVRKYGLEAVLAVMYPSTGGGAGSRGYFEDLMTLTLLKSFPAGWIKAAYLGDGKLYRVPGGNQRLYDRISDILGSDVLYDTITADAERDDTGVKLVVKGKTGEKLIVAKKLLFAVQPTRENLAPFGLNEAEKKVFSKAKYGRSHTAIVSHPRLVPGTTLRNTPASALQRPLAPFLTTPYVTSFGSYGNSTRLFSLGASGSDYATFDAAAAQALAQASLERMAAAGVLANLQGEKLHVVAWSDHEAGGFGASPEDMRAGWMRELYSLQGKRSTWFTGGGVASDFTTMLWKFNDDLLARVVKEW